jgi:Xaa-Pro aminopeptidase
VDPSSVIHEHRLKKTSEELELMRHAAEITEQGHREVMARTAPGMYEYEAEALLRAAFRRSGSERHAYPPIVASGENATILHYRKNDRRMRDGDLLLIDAGSEYGYYASDVTRTFPVNGRFSQAQRAVYEVVLAAELEAIRAVRVGATVDDVHRAAVRIVLQGLVDLGVISGPLDKALEEERHKPWFMHRTSHWLGMDVHDVGSYHLQGTPRPLEAGMVLTVEPGLYFSSTDERVPAELRGRSCSPNRFRSASTTSNEHARRSPASCHRRSRSRSVCRRGGERERAVVGARPRPRRRAYPGSRGRYLRSRIRRTHARQGAQAQQPLSLGHAHG